MRHSFSFPRPTQTLFALLALGLVGESAAADKRAYSFANPTPDALLREMSTDRPDSTESPFTVDAGRVQIEMDVMNFTHDDGDGVRTREWGIAPFNLRLGIRHNFELGVFVAPFVHLTERPDGGAKTTARGAGDTTLRAKFNFWGNDDGPTAFGVFVDLKVPTAARGLGNDKFEGAVTLPFAFELGGGWEGAAMTLIEIVHTGTGGYRPVWGNTLTVGHEIVPGVGGFLELVSSAGDGPHTALFNAGLTHRINPNTQLDCGVNLGLSRAAPDVGLFVGLSRRF